jgi:hypothetical protein
MENDKDLEAVKNVIATLFAARRILCVLAPQFKWTGLGSLLGDYGELIAVRHYGFLKAPAGSSGFDAVTPEGKRVQIKVTTSLQIGFRGDADLMLVLRIKDTGDWEEIYFGPFADVVSGAAYSKRDNKQVVQTGRLQDLQRAIKEGNSKKSKSQSAGRQG